MSLTPSNMLPLGKQAPLFSLVDTKSENTISLDSFADKKVLVVMFICNHCPYVIHMHDELLRLDEDYKDSPVGLVAISSNDVEHYPQDGPDQMKVLAQKLGFSFPYLYDVDQSVAKAYDAACTPDFYVFNEGRKLVYRGRLDESRPGNDLPLNGNDLRSAINQALIDQPVNEEQFPSVGCNIKWK